MIVHGKEVRGSILDEETRCEHYHTKRDIIAIKFACCKTYYPCFQCHQEHANHPAQTWKRENLDEEAILCGNCGHELTINEYLQSGAICPKCKAHFNPGCHSHLPLYFQT